MVLRKDFDLDAWLSAWKTGVKMTWGEDKPHEVVALESIVRGLSFTAPELFQMRAREAWNLFNPLDPECPALRAGVALAYLILEAVEKAPSEKKEGASKKSRDRR